MTRTLDGCRRAASVVLVAALLVLVPSVAMARLTSSRAPAPLSVGTGSMVTPSAITGSYACSQSGPNEIVTVTVTRFTDGGPAGSSYVYGLTLGPTGYDSATSTSTTQSITLTGSKKDDKTVTSWALGVQALRGNWTSGTGMVTISCPGSGNKSGTF